VAKKQIKRVKRVPKDIRPEAVDMSKAEVRYLMKDYYNISAAAMSLTSHRRLLNKKEHSSICTGWMWSDVDAAKDNLVSIFDIWTEKFLTGRWIKSHQGLGPVVAAGLLCVFDVTKAPTSSSLVQFAGFGDKDRPTKKQADALIRASIERFGYEPTPEHMQFFAEALQTKFEVLSGMSKTYSGDYAWELIQRALICPPWNPIAHQAGLIAGQTFVWSKGSFYNTFYEHEKLRYGALNNAGMYKHIAEFELRTKNYKRNTKAKQAYKNGKLPESRVKARARRSAIKAFLRHTWMVEYRAHTGEMPPEHYAVDVLGGSHRLVVPNWPRFD
jgi:hypothetical protein